MAKHSKHPRCRLHQSGMGGGFTITRRVPIRVQRTLPHAPALDPVTDFRWRCVEYAKQHGVMAAVRVFHRSRATIYRWRQRYDPAKLTSLQPRSRCPKRTRRCQWTATQEQAVLDLRTTQPRTGKAKLHHLRAQQGTPISISTIGRILTSLRRRQLLVEPHGVRVRQARPARPYAVRVPKDKRQPTQPGAVIQLDTMHLRPLPGVERRPFTALDVVSRVAVLGVRSHATAGTATAFLTDLIARMPVPIQAIQVDGGSEFLAAFEAACQAKGMARSVLPPWSPKLNGRVERLNGTVRREFWECYDGELDLPTLQAALRTFEDRSNTERPHQALGYATPIAHLATFPVSHVST